MQFKKDWEQLLKNDQNPFPSLDANQLLAIPGAEAELARRIDLMMEQEGVSLDQAFVTHYNTVLQELKDGKFDITVDRLRITSPTDITNDVNSFKSDSSEWLNNEVTNSVFENVR